VRDLAGEGRRIARLVDALVAGEMSRAAMWRELGTLLAMGATIYILRVGWRLQLFSAAYRLGVELRSLDSTVDGEDEYSAHLSALAILP
jgi:hypothetical protein